MVSVTEVHSLYTVNIVLCPSDVVAYCIHIVEHFTAAVGFYISFVNNVKTGYVAESYEIGVGGIV